MQLFNRGFVLVDGLGEDRLASREVDRHEEQPRPVRRAQGGFDGEVARQPDRADRQPGFAYVL